MNGARTRRRAGGESGVSALEFALVLPVLLTIVMGLVEFGNVLFLSSAMDKAAQMGARAAVTGRGEDDGTRLNRIVQAALDVAEPAAGGRPVSVLVRSWPGTDPSATATTGDAGRPCAMVEVEVRCDYQPVTPIVGDMLPENIPLRGQGRMINEPWTPCG
jgi:Flp pilus assembly protein TadG